MSCVMTDWWDGIVPAVKPRPNEKLWEVWARHKLLSCELKYHGEFGVEARIFENAELLVGYRHQTRALAVQMRNVKKRTSRKAAADGGAARHA
jgi:hypothetical protein